MLEWGTKNGLELNVAWPSMMFSAVKSWNFVGLVCLLLAGRGFKNCSTGTAGTSPSTTLWKKERRCYLRRVGPVGWGGLVYGDTAWFPGVIVTHNTACSLALDPFKWVDVCLVVGGGGDSSVVRAPDSWLKGRGFESLLERRENFLLQGRLSVLTLISVSVPPPCYHSST